MNKKSLGSLSMVAAAFLTCLAAANSASAHPWRHRHHDDHPLAPSRLRLTGGAHFGIAGEIEGDNDSPFDGKLDLATTFGGQLGVDAVVFRFFAIGGEVRVAGFNTEEAERRGIDRSLLVDLDVKPRLRIPLVNQRLEFYFSTPVGLTVPILSDEFAPDDRVDGKPGWNLGVGGGMTFFVTRHFGLNVEPMYVMRWFGIDGPGGDVDLRMRQFTLFTNAVFAI